MADVKELARLIDLIAKRMPGGVPALLGLRPAPTREELELTRWRPSTDAPIVSCDAPHDALAENACANVSDFGILDEVPWGDITAAVAWYSSQDIYKRDWAIYLDYVRLWGVPRSYGAGAIADALAEKYDISTKTAYRLFRRVPESVAQLAIMGTFGGCASTDDVV